MLTAAVILALACASHASTDQPLNDLKVRYEAPGVEYIKDPSFVSIPRNEASAVHSDYLNLTPEGNCINEYEGGIVFYGHRYQPIHKDGKQERVFVSLYDSKGSIAGVQACWPMSMLTRDNNDMNVTAISSYQIIKENGEEFACQTAYFIDPSQICYGGRTAAQVKAEGTVRELSFQWGKTPETLKFPPVNRADAKADKWSMNRCFDRMGYHNFYDVENYSESKCTKLHGYFLLYHPTTLKLIGFGFTFEGKSESKMTETPPTFAVKVIQGCAPKCIVDRSEKYGAATMHVYFIAEPKNLSCGIKTNLSNMMNIKVEEDSRQCARHLQ